MFNYASDDQLGFREVSARHWKHEDKKLGFSGFQGCVLYHEATFKYTHIFLLVFILNVNMINFLPAYVIV